MLKWVDMPPVWLAGAIGLAWVQKTHYSLGLDFGLGVADLLGGLLVGGGLLLMALAVYEMRRQKTTIIPHQDADKLVTAGIFKRTRNPIYLGDAMVLAGLILYWDAVLALPLIPIFVWIIEKRFIIGEEDRLRRKFRMTYARYCDEVRRWI
ncbi:MAG: isoprenylcysteine carboxylmethyltransferase family protein [Pelagimonas sp.]|jgi:protein-S-isoprenylcysteine O-methyltransferase Ste14|nr:isoprenylcysteine carboxylmethyltransferase family protein [Pelagimonas sp.]